MSYIKLATRAARTIGVVCVFTPLFAPEPADQENAYRAIGRAMLKANRGAELYAWLAEMPSDVARTAACMGAAEGIQSPSAQK